MVNNTKHVKEPLVHLTRRLNVPARYAWLIRIGAFVLSILVCCLVSCMLSSKVSVGFFFKHRQTVFNVLFCFLVLLVSFYDRC